MHPVRQPSARDALLLRSLSEERLGPYLRARAGDLPSALLLYEWNAAVGSAFFEVLCHLEVLLRNALSEQLVRWHQASGRPGEWYDDPAGILSPKRHEDIRAAANRLRRDAFPGLAPQTRTAVYDVLDPLVRLRNRIAHHEPIHHADLIGRHDDVLTLAGHLGPDLRSWLAEVSQVPAFLAGRP